MKIADLADGDIKENTVDISTLAEFLDNGLNLDTIDALQEADRIINDPSTKTFTNVEEALQALKM